MVALIRGDWSFDASENRTHPFGLRVGKAFQQQSVHDGKDCRVRADGEGQSSDYRGGKAGIARELAEAVSCFLPEDFEAGTAALIPHGLLYLLDATDPGEYASPSLGWRHPGGDPFVSQQLHVCTEFVVQVTLCLVLVDEVFERTLNSGPEIHVPPPTLLSMRSSWPAPLLSIVQFRLQADPCLPW